MPRDPWRSLEPVHIVSTAARLERRIREPFNDLVFLGIAVVFLLGLERRLQRRPPREASGRPDCLR